MTGGTKYIDEQGKSCAAVRVAGKLYKVTNGKQGAEIKPKAARATEE